KASAATVAIWALRLRGRIRPDMEQSKPQFRRPVEGRPGCGRESEVVMAEVASGAQALRVHREDGVLRVTIVRPERMNALDAATVEALTQVLTDDARGDDV